jgi:hypothetical protein
MKETRTETQKSGSAELRKTWWRHWGDEDTEEARYGAVPHGWTEENQFRSERFVVNVKNGIENERNI